MITARNKSFARFTTNPIFLNRCKYTELRNRTITQIRKGKMQYESKLVDNIRADSKQFYSYVNSKWVARDRIGPLKDVDGRVVYRTRR